MTRDRRSLPVLVVGGVLLGSVLAVLLMQILMTHAADGCQDAPPTVSADVSGPVAVSVVQGLLSPGPSLVKQQAAPDSSGPDVCTCGAGCASALVPARRAAAPFAMTLALVVTALVLDLGLVRPNLAGQGRTRRRGPPSHDGLLTTLCVARI